MILSDSLGLQINALSRALAGQLTAELQPIGLTPAQWAVLQYVTEQPGMHQERIAVDLGADAATLTGVLNRLQAKGLVRRSPDPADGRRRLVEPTDEGDGTDGSAAAEAVNDRALAGFTAMERATLAGFLKRLQANLATQPADQ